MHSGKMTSLPAMESAEFRQKALNAMTLLPPPKKSRVAGQISNAGAAMSSSSSQMSADDGDDAPTSVQEGGSTSHSANAHFKQPRKRNLPATGEHSALEDRVIAAQTKAQAEQLEQQAEAIAAKAAKKARTTALKQSAAKAKGRHSKSSSANTELDLDEFPGAEY